MGPGVNQTVILCLKGVMTGPRGPANNEAYIFKLTFFFSFGVFIFISRKKRCEEASTSQKLSQLVDQLPQFLATANQAAEAHTRALAKWEKKFGLDDSSSSSD